jgi:pimeloyl-ACP methyl ester carboxylesterase
MACIRAAGHRLEYARIPARDPGGPAIVLLHEGLGSISMWRDFPQRVADATGHEVVVYSRYGYGCSDRLTGGRDVRYMHDEALIALPEVLDALSINRPILLGHSDGASIAIIHAGGPCRAVAGLVLMAPHVVVEDISVDSIAAARVAYETSDLRARLARHHDDVDATFRGWNDIWLDPAFRNWSIEEFLPQIDAPVLVIQGLDDEYGTLDQVERIERAAREVQRLELANCGHSPHRDQPEKVLDAITMFIARVDR